MEGNPNLMLFSKQEKKSVIYSRLDLLHGALLTSHRDFELTSQTIFFESLRKLFRSHKI